MKEGDVIHGTRKGRDEIGIVLPGEKEILVNFEKEPTPIEQFTNIGVYCHITEKPDAIYFVPCDGRTFPDPPTKQ